MCVCVLFSSVNLASSSKNTNKFSLQQLELTLYFAVFYCICNLFVVRCILAILLTLIFSYNIAVLLLLLLLLLFGCWRCKLLI